MYIVLSRLCQICDIHNSSYKKTVYPIPHTQRTIHSLILCIYHWFNFVSVVCVFHSMYMYPFRAISRWPLTARFPLDAWWNEMSFPPLYNNCGGHTCMLLSCVPLGPYLAYCDANSSQQSSSYILRGHTLYLVLVLYLLQCTCGY